MSNKVPENKYVSVPIMPNVVATYAAYQISTLSTTINEIVYEKRTLRNPVYEEELRELVKACQMQLYECDYVYPVREVWVAKNSSVAKVKIGDLFE